MKSLTLPCPGETRDECERNFKKLIRAGNQTHNTLMILQALLPKGVTSVAE